MVRQRNTALMRQFREDYRRFHRRRYEMLLDLLEEHVPYQADRCLDVGGGGDVANLADVLVRRYARELHAIDQGGDVAIGREKGIEVRECNVDVETFPYDEGFFDIVLFTSVIEHLYNPRHALDEITRTLKPGGLLILETPNATAFGRRIDALFGKNPFRWFNEYNALGDKAPMIYCAVFYSAHEIEVLLARDYTVLVREYAMHDPPVNVFKWLVREMVSRVWPSLSDCFFIVAQRGPV